MNATDKLDLKAIDATITHWREDYWKLRLFGGDQIFRDTFNRYTCKLCTHHSEICEWCPLKDMKANTCCRPYERALYANARFDKRAFMAARAALLKRLYRARAKLRKGT